MWADCFTKPLQGAKFIFFCQIIMNEPDTRSVLKFEETEEDEGCREDKEKDKNARGLYGEFPV